MPQASDSSYAAVTRFRRPYATTPPVWIDDESWRQDRLPLDELDVQKFESAVAPLLEEGELDADAIVVTPSGNSSSAANHAAERRRREERWTDNGLDQLLQENGSHLAGSTSANAVAGNRPGNTNTSGSNNS